eukprot:g2544.t1
MLSQIVQRGKLAGIKSLTKEGAAFALGFRSGAKSGEEKWFSESEVLWPGQRFSLKVERELYRGRSKYQDILLFESSTYGKVLVLDGVIQLTERDEFAYQEMIAHLPLYSHPDPRSVLIVGGGDGGVLREVARHPGVKRIVMCEIDAEVVRVAKQFKLQTATSFDDPRLELLFEDASEYVKRHKNEFDVIIVDSSDPEGPAEALFEAPFFTHTSNALRSGGIMCTQGECLWLHLDIISKVLQFCGDLAPIVDYAYTTIPTYPSGQIGFVLLCKDAKRDLRAPVRKPDAAMSASLQYYNSNIHSAAFVLPTFAERVIAPLRKRP